MRSCPNCGYVKTSYGDPEVGAKLRRIREKAGLSIQQVAALANQPASTIGAIERGDRKARRAAVEPVMAAIRRHAEELREAARNLEDETAEGERILRLQEGEGLRGGGLPTVVPAPAGL